VQAIGIVSVLASALVALVATIVAARTQIRLHRLQQTDARLAELRSVIDTAAKVVVRAKYALADAKNIRKAFEWDREFWVAEARLRVRLGSGSKLHDEFFAIWGALNDLQTAYSENKKLSTDRAVELWEGVDDAMDQFFESTAPVLGPDPRSLDAPPASVRERLADHRERVIFRRRLRRVNRAERRDTATGRKH
jgi:hypothetical protein